jgi:16S rRNA (cytidine1402-2'-O)-methyltransferase
MTSYGKLTLGAVPIGDFKDASLNLIDYIVNHKIILVENMDVFNKLCKDLNIKTDATIIEYGNHDLPDESDKYINVLKNGEDILFLSDEGTAGLIDPGGNLMQIARQNQIKVKVMSGPNAIIPSVILARFSTHFYFHGPSPEKEERVKSFKRLSNFDSPIVFFVTREYIEDFIQDAIEYFGNDRRVFISSNLTKDNEFTVFTTLESLSKFLLSGEMDFSITLVIEGKPPH